MKTVNLEGVVAGLSGRWTAAVAAGVVLAAFAAGVGVGRLSGSGERTSPSAVAASGGDIWSLFGKLRPANAPRAGVKKPDGFVVWTSRLDTRGASPAACVRMTEPLDPRKS